MNIFNLFACATCGASFEKAGDSIGYSILFLLVIILTMLAGVGFFMIRLARREQANLDPELRDDFVSQ